MSEVLWKPIPGFEGLYSASNLGQVRSEDRIVTDRRCVRKFKGKVRKSVLDPKGYYRIVLRKENKSYCFLLHRLILLTFRGASPAGLEGCHLDSNSSNNLLENLAWASHAENEKHKIANGTSNRGSQHYLSKLTEEDVMGIKKLLRSGVSQHKAAANFGVDRRVVNQIATGKTWKHVELSYAE